MRMESRHHRYHWNHFQNFERKLNVMKFIRFQQFFFLWNCFRTGSWFPTPGQCVRVSYSTLLQASCDLCLCIPVAGPCRTKQLLIVTHTSAHIHAQHPDTCSPIPLSLYQSQFLALGLCARVMLAFFTIIAFWSAARGTLITVVTAGGFIGVGVAEQRLLWGPERAAFPRCMQKCPLSRSKTWASPRRE